jgi:hypothetical protein
VKLAGLIHAAANKQNSQRFYPKMTVLDLQVGTVLLWCWVLSAPILTATTLGLSWIYSLRGPLGSAILHEIGWRGVLRFRVQRRQVQWGHALCQMGQPAMLPHAVDSLWLLSVQRCVQGRPSFYMAKQHGQSSQLMPDVHLPRHQQATYSGQNV